MAQRRVISFSIEGFMYSLRIVLFTIFLFLVSCSPEHSRLDGAGSSDGTDPQGFDASTEKYYAGCVDKYKGRWSFGLSPFGCAMPPGDEKRATAKFKPYAILLSDRKNAEEKTRFVQVFHDFIIETAKEYLERRELEVHPKDLSAWLQLILVTAHQESYWTQYRLNEEDRLLLMRGDNNHGYGFMQIDDRSHEEFLHTGNVFDLKEHLIYAMDLLYSLRRSVRKKPCSKALGYTKQNRSIYSSYNGGLGSKCRWKNPGSKWARNDKGFLAKYKLRAWTEFVPLSPLIIDSVVSPNENEEPPGDELTLPDNVPLPTFRPTEEDIPGTNNMDAVQQSLEGEDDEQGSDEEVEEEQPEENDGEDDVIPENPDELDPREGAY